ncbi:MAG: hypothetical protein C0593_06215 [Marinilabiliales bacterium]|nr:MAG: hypothetical protein C0593_06215 [Marinilabiliales bacterium]
MGFVFARLTFVGRVFLFILNLNFISGIFRNRKTCGVYFIRIILINVETIKNYVTYIDCIYICALA